MTVSLGPVGELFHSLFVAKMLSRMQCTKLHLQ